MKTITIPFIKNNLELDNLLIAVQNNKYFFIYRDNDKLQISNNINLLKNFLNSRYKDIICQIFPENKELINKTYNFFEKNSPSMLLADEIKKIDLSKFDFNNQLAIPDDKIKIFNNLVKNQSFNYIDTNYKIYKNEKRKTKNFSFDKKNDIEEKLASIFQIEDKMAFLVGTTGIGKTYAVKQLAKKNNMNICYTAVSGTGDARVAVIGQKTLEIEDNKQKVTHNPGAGLVSFRKVVEEKEDAVLIIDEILRGSASDITTIFSIEKDEEGNKYYDIEGVEYYYIIEIENIKGEKAKVLLSDRNVAVDFENGTILKPAKIDANKNQIIEFMKNGNISKVTKEFLNKHNYTIINKLEKIKEHFYIPADKLKICLIANVGEEFHMSKLDSATISRSGTIIIDNTKIKPDDMLKILKGNSKQDISKMRPLTKEEQELKEKFLIEFFKSIKTGIQLENIMLPKRAYSMRNLETLYSVNYIPENETNIIDYYKKLVNDLFILNFVDYEIGKENIEPDSQQLGFIKQSIEELKEILLNPEKEFSIEEEFENNLTSKNIKKVAL